MKQEIRFARTRDGVRIAYAVAGRGHTLVQATHWLTHVELDWQTPVLGPRLRALASRYRLVRYNPRGYPPSEGGGRPLTIDTFMADLEAVTDAACDAPFALHGSSGGGPVAIAFAARHPERVSHLVLASTFARGFLVRNNDAAARERFAAMLKLVELGWGEPNDAFRQLMTTQLFPDINPAQVRSINELQRMAASGEEAAKMLAAVNGFDVSADLAAIRAPTLVLHSRGDVRVPIEWGRELAAGIPGARFVPLETRNHAPLEGEPAFEAMTAAFDAFLPAAGVTTRRDADGFGLTKREAEVLELIASGLGNAEIAARLARAEKTIRNQASSVFAKLGVATRAEAIVRARRAGFGGD